MTYGMGSGLAEQQPSRRECDDRKIVTRQGKLEFGRGYKLLVLARGRIGSGSAALHSSHAHTHRQVDIKLAQRRTASAQLRSSGSQHERREPPELSWRRNGSEPHLTSTEGSGKEEVKQLGAGI